MREAIRLALTLGVLVGCAEDQEARLPVSSGLDAERAVTSLSAEEEATLCDATMDGLREVVSRERFCLVSAAAARDDPAACAARREECLARFSGELYERDEVWIPYPSDCALTVGEHEACWNAALASTGRLLGTISCDDAPRLSREAVVALKVDFSVPECAAISACR